MSALIFFNPIQTLVVFLKTDPLSLTIIVITLLQIR